MKVTILVRVYDRVDDLSTTLRLIKDTWNSYDYEVVLISNGKNNGYIPDQETCNMADKIIMLEENAGHLKGSSQLLLTGIKNISLKDCSYLIILEADTWIYGDSLVRKYIKKMESEGSVWASARWYDRFCSLATDFAIIKTSYLVNNTKLFDFTYFPECHMANYLRDNRGRYVYIKENMQTLIPSYIHFEWPYSRKGRFNCFPQGKMVTHHVEDYVKGFETKKQDFNAVVGFDYFKDVPKRNLFLRRTAMRLSHFFQSLLPKRSWLGARCYLDIDARMRMVNSNSGK